MATPAEWFVGLSWFANLALDGGAAYYCYKITRITGGFRAWWLVIGFTVVFAVSSFWRRLADDSNRTVWVEEVTALQSYLVRFPSAVVG